jgi:chemotaxis protein methyltransferase WspC
MHLKTHGPSVAAFYLLGLIAEAQASPQAIEYYRKALYLDPKHEDTMRQLALISERDGDQEHARNLRRRVSQRRGATA